MSKKNVRWRGVSIGMVCLALLAAACGNSESGGGSATTTTGDAAVENVAVDQPGVTATEIRVGGLLSETNPLGAGYDTAADGVNAYFAMVNDAGGIYGRNLVLATVRDDRVAANAEEAQGLITQDNVFAVLPVATLLFGGADLLAAEGIPTFGWAINPEWEGTADNPKPNLFGQAGSFLCLGCSQPTMPWLAREAGTSRIGVLAYAVPQSSRCAAGWVSSFEEFGEGEVVYSDDSLSYGVTDLSVQVSRMKDANVDMVVTCMDTNGVVVLAREMRQQGVDAIQFLPNGYDQDLLDEFGDLFEGSYTYVSFAPLEADPEPEGIRQFRDWMDRTGGEITENSLVGWINAAQFVEGLRLAGPDFTRAKVVESINAQTDVTLDGLLPGIDWTIGHTEPQEPSCNAFLRITDGEFVPVAPEGKVFICLARNDLSLTPTYR